MALDKSWMSKRGGASYIKGVQQFVNFVKENAAGQTQFPCPCQHCKNSKGHIDLDEIGLHLLKNGMHQSYVIWKHHGEKSKGLGGNIPTMANPIKESNFSRLEDLIDDVYNIHTKEAEHSPVDVSETNEDDKVDDTIVEPGMKKAKGSVHPLSIDNDPLTQMFGKKAKRLPGVGSFVSKRKYDAALHAHIMYTEERGERECLKNKVDEMQTNVNFIFDYCKSQIGGPPTPIFQSTSGSSTHVPMPHAGGLSSPIPMSQTTGGSSSPMLQELQATVGKSTPMPPVTMNNAHGPSLGKRDSMTSAYIESTPTTRLCELFDWNWNCVAVAKEVIDPMHRDNCHNYQLDPQYEMKVSMCIRKIFSAKLYKETPDAKIIKEVGVGEFLVWPKSHIKFIEASI